MDGPPKLFGFCAHPGNIDFNNNFTGARAVAVQFLPLPRRLSNFCRKPPTFGGPSMPRLQHSDPGDLRVVILKGEVVLRCHDLPLLYS